MDDELTIERVHYFKHYYRTLHQKCIHEFHMINIVSKPNICEKYFNEYVKYGDLHDKMKKEPKTDDTFHHLRKN